MSDPETISVPLSWLAETVVLLDGMAGEGIEIDGCADPTDLMTDLATALGGRPPSGYKLCPECGQPVLKKGQQRKHPDDYRHARGCPNDDCRPPANDR